MGYILALVGNLFFQARIQAVAKHVGVELKVVGTGEQLVAEATARPPALVIVDLNSHAGPLEAIGTLRRDVDHLEIIGYLAHTQTELAQKAAAAGCTQVMSQGKFTQELPALLARARAKLEPSSRIGPSPE